MKLSERQQYVLMISLGVAVGQVGFDGYSDGISVDLVWAGLFTFMFNLVGLYAIFSVFKLYDHPAGPKEDESRQESIDETTKNSDQSS